MGRVWRCVPVWLLLVLAVPLTAVRAQSATVNDDQVDTLATATDLTAGTVVVRRMTVTINGCRNTGGLRNCYLFMSAQAGGGSASVSALRWGTTDAGCVTPVENAAEPSISPVSAAVLQVAAGGGSGRSITGTVVLCYTVNWLTAPARFTPTLYFRLYEN